ncbi:glutathione peroxidase [Rhodococcus fascians]|nr:glutathione peroxidase [Rhodococcus fascians]MBY4140968.1 glutathione peroxidase [Rhodococcus fascians]MBY4219632.1 glutathione peroxidase [Rhodococcus fascians]MBY4221941.1 glutathione peroxidase [Rhodococcus fascians]MBY4233942.1 glutathione peroxidase [Rhodococcus fascians]
MTTVHDFDASTADGSKVALSDYAGKTLLIVNTASKCGLSEQYAGLEALYRDLHDTGFEVLAFPCNQFLDQEPGSDAEIQDFCRTNFDVTFPVFAKVDVNGDEATPLYKFLRTEQPGDFGPKYGKFYEAMSNLRPDAGPDDVSWNFTKFLVDGEGRVVARYEPPVEPSVIAEDIAARAQQQ